MRSLTREEAIRLCESHSVFVEFNNLGLRVLGPFTPKSQHYPSNGPNNYESLRYFLEEGPVQDYRTQSGNGAGSRTTSMAKSVDENGGGKEDWTKDSGSESEVDRMPAKKAEAKPKLITVKILAEDGKSAPAKGILPGKPLKLKAIPSEGAGTYAWKAKTKGLKLEGNTAQTVTITFEKDKEQARGGEVVELTFTPSGQTALAPLSHTLDIVKVLIMKNDSHAWGYDEFLVINAKDQNSRQFQFTPDSKLDLISIQKGKTGLVDVYYEGTEGANLHFKVKDEVACKCKPRNVKTNPIVLELEAKSGKYKETRLEVRLDGESGFKRNVSTSCCDARPV